MKLAEYSKLFALIVTTFCCLSASGANAQVRSTPKYYDENKSWNCSNVYACSTEFTALPLDKQVEFTNVSCYVKSNAPLRIGSISVASTTYGYNITSQVLSLSSSFFSTASNQYFYNFNIPIRFLMGVGRYPRLDFETDQTLAYINANCTIVGTPVAP